MGGRAARAGPGWLGVELVMTANPGSEEAGERGCTCPVIDNHYGEGWGLGPCWYISIDCPLHASTVTDQTILPIRRSR